MTGIIVAPDLGTELVDRSGVFTVDAMDTRLLECNCPRRIGNGCGGIDVNKLPQEHRAFELKCKEMGQRFIRQQKARGFEWAGDLVVHGPFQSYDFANTMQDFDSPQWRNMQRSQEDGMEHPDQLLPMVFERFTHLADYVVVGKFLFKDVMTDMEEPVGS